MATAKKDHTFLWIAAGVAVLMLIAKKKADQQSPPIVPPPTTTTDPDPAPYIPPTTATPPFVQKDPVKELIPPWEAEEEPIYYVKNPKPINEPITDPYAYKHTDLI
jgi:hypothetical protein